MRLDRYLAIHNLLPSRTLAQKVIRLGAVQINDKRVIDVAYEVLPNDRIEIERLPLTEFVSQGALKLLKAIQLFGCRFDGLRVWDIGASTGGFTQCALLYGAAEVYATDVGHEQLHPLLRSDPRVRAFEGLNVKEVTAELFAPTAGIDVAVCDVSFLSLTAIFPVLASLLPEAGWAICLVKPQFEMGERFSNKHGVVRGKALHERILHHVCTVASEVRLTPIGLTYSPLGGGKQKNIEYLLWVQKGEGREGITLEVEIPKVVASAHAELD